MSQLPNTAYFASLELTNDIEGQLVDYVHGRLRLRMYKRIQDLKRNWNGSITDAGCVQVVTGVIAYILEIARSGDCAGLAAIDPRLGQLMADADVRALFWPLPAMAEVTTAQARAGKMLHKYLADFDTAEYPKRPEQAGKNNQTGPAACPSTCTGSACGVARTDELAAERCTGFLAQARFDFLESIAMYGTSDAIAEALAKLGADFERSATLVAMFRSLVVPVVHGLCQIWLACYPGPVPVVPLATDGLDPRANTTARVQCNLEERAEGRFFNFVLVQIQTLSLAEAGSSPAEAGPSLQRAKQLTGGDC